ncbi:hypothetical protein [Paenibacillus sp. HJGM_3]|uniref:hypothetical protein n=1 Tax=Paenibacillus sp. HJGM_3 TaxID=3379816 RepID=UPI00385DD3F7
MRRIVVLAHLDKKSKLKMKPIKETRKSRQLEYMAAKAYAEAIVKQATTFKPSKFHNFGALTISDHITFSEIPNHPFWSKIENRIDFTIADHLFTRLYTPTGVRPYAPTLRLKIKLVQVFEQLSPADLELKLMFDMAVRRFIGIPMSFKKFDMHALALTGSPLETVVLEACLIQLLLQAKPYLSKRSDSEAGFDQWFSDYVSSDRLASYPRILNGVLKLVQHLRQTHPVLIRYAYKQFPLDEWLARNQQHSSIHEKANAISLMSIRAMMFLNWFDSDEVRTLLRIWKDPVQQLRSLELQALLYESLCPTAFQPAKEPVLV